MKEDGRCIECELAAAKKEAAMWKEEALRHAANAANWEERARKSEVWVEKVMEVLTPILEKK